MIGCPEFECSRQQAARVTRVVYEDERGAEATYRSLDLSIFCNACLHLMGAAKEMIITTRLYSAITGGETRACALLVKPFADVLLRFQVFALIPLGKSIMIIDDKLIH